MVGYSLEAQVPIYPLRSPWECRTGFNPARSYHILAAGWATVSLLVALGVGLGVLTVSSDIAMHCGYISKIVRQLKGIAQ